ncbi:MAG: adenylate/guanylate cyclase domain-containing protein [Reyranella sp.]|nr:adenylate/guanylate cyclase domain-containing protein [Reyranella sp.]
MQEIAQWLEKLGLAEYAPRFQENRIDLSVLPDLTDQDLRDLGIVLGDRRKLLRAIGELDAKGVSNAREAGSAERRQLTLLFCDLVGSTSLSTQLDVEDLRALIAAYHRRCTEVVERNGGYVAKYMGDGLLVYFGYPLAHEHDAERAVRTGLELVGSVGELVTPTGKPLQIRVGIATGEVVVGDVIGAGASRELGVVGETPNLAARLQGIANPDTVVIADGTRRLVGNLFELRDLGPHALKGIDGRVQAWAALRAGGRESRFEALQSDTPVALQGRKDEEEILMACWRTACAGQGRLVLLSGEAGIGKSRLIADLAGRLTAAPYARLRAFCSPQHNDSAFYPFVAQLERAAGFASDDIVAAKLDKLDALLVPALPAPGDRALLASLLGIPNDGRHPEPVLTPPQLRQQTFDVMARYIQAMSDTSPLLMLFEDAHWADPSSLELLGRLIDGLAGRRIMVVVTSRPEFVPPWTGVSEATVIVLDRLARRDAEAMVDRLTEGQLLPASVRRDILDRADGIPLFVQELTKAVLESAQAGATFSVPATLQASLMARLDRLGTAKELAQVGAVIGRRFSHAMLVAAAGRPEAEIDASVDRLIAAGLVLRDGQSPQATYLFNHALVQDAAYGTLLREPRRALHQRIAETLESQFAEIAENQPELMARHCSEAGLIEKAAALWGKAGRRSLERSALLEAAEQLGRALGLIASLTSSQALRREEIRLQIDLSNALIHVKGHASAETQAAFERARKLIDQAQSLGEPIEDPLMLYSALYGAWVANRMAFRGDVVLELATQFQAMAESEGTPSPRMIGHLIMGISKVLTGDFAGGRAELDRAIDVYDPAAHRTLATRFGHDVRVSALAWRAFALWALGDAAAAQADIDRAIDDARSIGHAATLMFALSHASLTLLHAGRGGAAAPLIHELVRFGDEKGTLYWKAYGQLLHGWLIALEGNAADALGTIEAGIAAMRSTGATGYAPWYLTILAKVRADVGEADEARRRIEEAILIAETTGERWCEADIHRTAGEIALMAGSTTADAMAHFERARLIAHRQQASSLEHRAAASMARIGGTGVIDGR